MENKIWYEEKDDILRHKVIGAYSSEEALKSGEIYVKLLQGKPLRQMIVDLSQAGSMENRETRKVTNETLKKADVSAVAFVGANAATRMIAKVMMKLSPEDIPTEFFKTDDKAVAWLKSKRESK